MRNIKILALVITLGAGNINFLQAQNVAKLYEKGMKAFYSEKFTEAVTFFEQIELTGRSFKDSKYRLELSYLVQSQNRERDLTTINGYRSSKAKTDKFYHYWMGRIYANRYMFPEAISAWKTFLNMKAQKSDEIIEETQGFLAQAEYLIEYFDNPDNYELHQLGAPINSKFDELTPAFSADNGRLLFASNRNESGTNQFQIFQSEMTDSGWNNPESIQSLGSFSGQYSNIEVVNEDGKLFIFRDKKDGDLFYSEYKNNSWTDPVEFDSKITTTKLGSHFYINEHEDRIIFSSLNKKYGLDLMESFKDAETGKWENPHLFSTNLNSEFDEDSPFLTADETTLYFSSDRPNGIGGFDVYESVYDKNNNSWSEPHNLGWPINSPDDELFFKMNNDGTSGYFSSNRIHSLGGYDIFNFWSIQKTKVTGKVLYAHNDQPVVKGEIRFHPTQYLDEYFRSKIDEFGNYSTEIISNETFRVEVLDGFDTLLTQPFAAEDVEGKSITHFKDFHIIDKSLSKAEQAALMEKYASEQIVKEISKQPQIKAEIAKQEKSIVPEPRVEAVATKKTTEPSVNKEIVTKQKSVDTIGGTKLKNIYFEYSTIRIVKESEPRLYELLSYLQSNPNKNIEISGHTDNIGTEQINQIVSENRAKSVKNWLVKNNIDPNRIVVVGYGESRPLASNDDEENGRDLNRRIEVRLID